MNYKELEHSSCLSRDCRPLWETDSEPHEILAIIPARGGSKGIPRKNIRLLGGKPLIAYSIETALAARTVSRVVVSTDDEEIAEVARSYGAEVPFFRPASLATDTSTIMQCLLQMKLGLYEREGYLPEAHVVLYPTHPFRKVSDVERLSRKLHEGCSTVTTYKSIKAPSEGYFMNENGRLQPLEDHGASAGGQEYQRSYGYFLGWSFSWQAHARYAHFLRDEVEMIDIDEWKDLRFAEEVIAHDLYDFEL